MKIYLVNNTCIKKETNQQCQKQTIKGCHDCSNGIVIGYGNCVDDVNLQNCDYFRTTKLPEEQLECLICGDNYVVGTDGECTTNTKEEVKFIRNEVNYKCQDGYYVDEEGNVLSSVEVKQGESAAYPEETPVKEGYIFVEYENVDLHILLH